jgi:anti-sigma factor RsiW
MNRTDPPHAPPLSEQDIQAYADGLLSPERTAHLRAYLGKRPGEARRVAFYGKLNEQIQRSFGPPDEPLPTLASDRHWLTRAARKCLAWRASAARLQAVRTSMVVFFAVVLALIAASGWMSASQVSPEALNNAAVMALMQATSNHAGNAQPLGESSERSESSTNGAASGTVRTTAASSVAAVPDSVQTTNLAASQDPAALAASAPNLTAVGMHLVSHRTMKLGPFAHASEYLYLNAERQPIVLVKAAARTASAQPQWSARRVGSLRLLAWTAHGERCVLAGTADARGLMRAADALTTH